jgi:tryptophan 2,3-dioxygenase
MVWLWLSMAEEQGVINMTQHYADYLQLDKILSAQAPVSAQVGKEKHDEMLFIIVHQAHELWFKQILYELDSIISILSNDKIDDSKMLTLVKRLQRITVIQNLLIEQISALDTMTPMDFLEFRDLIVPASGFQSLQFRLLEIKLGIMRTNHQMHCLHADEVRSITQAKEHDTLFHSIETWLERTPFINSHEFVFWKEYKQAVFDSIEHDKKLILDANIAADDEKQQRLNELDATRQRFAAFFDKESYQQLIDKGERRLSFKASTAALFIFLYRDHPVLQLPYQILSSLISIDELLSRWRSKHLLMVQRMIGAKMGTGGSSGVAYLEIGLRNQVFADLTSLSTFMVKSSALPELPQNIRHELGFTYHSDEGHR